MGKMNEIFVAVKETDYIEAQIGTDDLDIRRATFDIVDMLCELKDIVRTMVPIYRQNDGTHQRFAVM